MAYSYRSIFNGQVVYYIAGRKITGMKGFSVSKLENGWWTHLSAFNTEEEARDFVNKCVEYRLTMEA